MKGYFSFQMVSNARRMNPYSGKSFFVKLERGVKTLFLHVFLKVMLHGTICNDDF